MLFAGRADDGVEGRLVEGAVQRAQHLHDRAERKLAVAEVEALADEHERGLRRAGDELGDEPRLADACLAPDEHGPRALVDDRRLPCALERAQLGASADEPGARDASGHGNQFGPSGIHRSAEFGRAHDGAPPTVTRVAWSGAHAGGRRRIDQVVRAVRSRSRGWFRRRSGAPHPPSGGLTTALAVSARLPVVA